MLDISFIVPIYNTPVNLLEECCKSFLEISNELKYEVILVDDGSDGYIESFLKLYIYRNGFKYYKTQNSGVSSARNTGIKLSRGRYICFVDPDDRIEFTITKDKFESLIEDVYLFEYCKFNNMKIIDKQHENLFNQQLFLSGKILFSNLLKVSEDKNIYDGFYLGTPWGKLFKREFIINNDIYFDKHLKKRQDAYFCSLVYLNTESIKVLNCNGLKYYYRIDNNYSVTKKYNENLKDIYVYLFNLMVNLNDKYELNFNYELSLYSYDLLKELLNLDYCNANNNKSYCQRRRDFIEFRNYKLTSRAFGDIEFKKMKISKKTLYLMEKKNMFFFLNFIYIFRKMRNTYYKFRNKNIVGVVL